MTEENAKTGKSSVKSPNATAFYCIEGSEMTEENAKTGKSSVKSADEKPSITSKVPK